jgi:tetratricopeptide (TPR) repeat protein
MDSVEQFCADSMLLPMTLKAIGQELLALKEFEQLKQYARKMIAFDAKKQQTRFPSTTDQKWNWVFREETGKLDEIGSYCLSTVYFQDKQYDSCLYYLQHAFYGHNYAPITHYTHLFEFGLHLRYMKSVCLEKTGRIAEAKSALLPYLFMDGINAQEEFTTHKEAVNQYLHLLQLEGTNESFTSQLDESISLLQPLDSVPKDSLALPMAWIEFHPRSAIYAFPIEGKYIPIVFNRLYMIDHPMPHKTIIIGEETKHRTLVESTPEPLDAEMLSYMKLYVKQTVLFTQ